MAAADLMADTVAEQLRADDTRVAALQGLEALPPPVPLELATAAVPALVDVAARTEDTTEFDRCSLLMARLVAEAAPDTDDVYGAAFGEGRRAAYEASPVIVKAAERAFAAGSGEPGLIRADAYSCACQYAHEAPHTVRGSTGAEAACGHTVQEAMRVVSDEYLLLSGFCSSPRRPRWHATC